MSSSRLLSRHALPDVRPQAFFRHAMPELGALALDPQGQIRARPLGALGAGGLESDTQLPQVVGADAEAIRQREAPGHV